MRYLHNDVDEICKYVQSHGLTVAKCDRDKWSQPVPVEAKAIEEMLTSTGKLWGTLLRYYLGVARSAEAEAPPLKDAVSKVEASRASSTILLVGYEDGGLISVSAKTLPCQIGAKSAEWWEA